ncbi:MAG: FAD-dependent oxidoreductase, partial [Protaetiibacter sp.]
MDYRGLSYWHDSVASAGDALERRPGIDGDADADVVIVGGGLTGLWTAWYLSEREPGARILVIEKEIAGFGASGRNGGWCSALFPRSTTSLAKAHGRDAALAMRRAMIETVGEVGRAAARAGVDCDYVRAGTVVYARSAVQ